MAFKRVVSAERKAMIGALKCMYFLTKREIPHTTNFTPLCELGKALGAQYLQDMQCGGAKPSTRLNISSRSWSML